MNQTAWSYYIIQSLLDIFYQRKVRVLHYFLDNKLQETYTNTHVDSFFIGYLKHKKGEDKVK